MAETAAAPQTLEEKKAAARARAKAARKAQEAGEAFVTISPAAADYIRESALERERPEGVRLRILQGLAWTGAVVDPDANHQRAKRLHAGMSKVSIWAIPAEEEKMIARDASRLMGVA